MASNDRETTAGGEQRPPATGAVHESRRRLLRGGLAAGPVLMSVSARPVLGAERCVAPSSFTSLDASGDNQTHTCLGRTPGFWKQPQKFEEWPIPYYPVATGGKQASSFDHVFGRFGGYPGKTLLDVLNIGGNDFGRDALARHIVAALLNAQKGWTPTQVLGVDAVKQIWRDFVARGYYEPTAGVQWYADESVPPSAGEGITAFLQSTMTL